MRRRDLLLGTAGSAMATALLVPGEPRPARAVTATAEARPPLSPIIVVAARDGDFVLPGVGSTSVAVERMRLRARGGLVATRVTPKLMTDGAARRQIPVRGEDPLSALVTPARSPLVLSPTDDNVVAGDFDLRGTRLPVFSLTETRGEGELEIMLDLRPISPLAPAFAGGGRAVDFGEGTFAGDGRRLADGIGSATIIEDPLFGRTPIARCVAHTDSEFGVRLTTDGVTDFWFFAAFRLWVMTSLHTGGRTTLLRALDTNGDEVFDLFVSGKSQPVLSASVTSGAASAVHADLGPLSRHWRDYDGAATPITTELVPVLVHYRAGDVLRIWIRHVDAPANATIPLDESTGRRDDPSARVVQELRAGALRPTRPEPPTVDMIAPRLWNDDPRPL